MADKRVWIISLITFVISFYGILFCYTRLKRENILHSRESYSIFVEDLQIPKQIETIGKRKIYVFFGTRPEIIKLAPLIAELKQSDKLLVTTIFTGQHADIIDQYLKLFNTKVDIWFHNILEKEQSINKLFGKIMLQADLLQTCENDTWIIQGDTSSALAIAAVAFHKKIKIAHIEAGLRTFNMHSPFPEEFNRKTISSIATYNFAPTVANAKNLINEGVDTKRVFITGNTVIDAVKFLNERKLVKIPSSLKSRHLKDLALVTIHRRENFKFSDSLYKAISSAKCKTCTFIVPMHPNPVSRKSAKAICAIDQRFSCVPPLPYEELHWMLKNAKVVLTDSGGIQEEVTWYNTPTIILRNSTERRESIEAGIAEIVNIKNLSIKIDLIFNKNITLPKKSFPYGDGNAAKKIVETLINQHLHFNDNVINPLKTNVTVNMIEYKTSTSIITDRLKKKNEFSVAVILQVYKRKSLSAQLEYVVAQSLKPSSVVIVQNGYYVDVTNIITEYRLRYPNIEFQHIAFSKNVRFHGRFHIAYLQKEDYVSVWDDDVYAKKDYLAYSLEYSKSHNFALIGANCRVFERVDLKKNTVVQLDPVGRCDFVGHIWTLPRQFLQFYLELEPLTLFTGEDIQLAFALQKYGIQSFKPPMQGDKYAGDLSSHGIDNVSSWRTNQSPRILLFCSLLKQNFKFISCKNCGDINVLNKCIELNKKSAMSAEAEQNKKDKLENKYVWFGIVKS